MKNKTALILALATTACVNNQQTTQGFHALSLSQADQTNNTLLVQQFSNLCLTPNHNADSLIERASLQKWTFASAIELKNNGLSKLKKTTLKIPGGGSPVEESQTILIKSLEEETLVLAISQRFDRKKLVNTQCAVFGKADEFLKHCASLGSIINRAPDHNKKYEETDAHFISWKATLGDKRARISCSKTPKSRVLPYEGTQLSANFSHVTPVKSVSSKKSNQQQFDVSER